MPENKPIVEFIRAGKNTPAVIKLNIEPQPKQQLFFDATTRYVAYGGARGGGKSWSARYKALYMCLHYNGFKCLIVRKTYPELKANHIDKFMEDMAGVMADGARRYDVTKGRQLCYYNKDDKELVFLNGSKIVFGYCDTEEDCNRYQGHEYDMIFLDEATHFTEYQFQRLSETCRGVNNFPHRIYLTCNPGGVGHGWVKRLFIERRFRENEDPSEYSFIPASLQDNLILRKTDPNYEKMLLALPYELRQADLYGNWDIFEGQFFKEFSDEIHVVEDCEIPSEWPRFRSLDYGLDMLACYWHAVKPTGEVITYKELFKSGLLPSAAAKLILEADMGDKPVFTYAPPDLWGRTKDRGRTQIELFFENGLTGIVQADNNREAGWWDVKEWMKVFEDKDGNKRSMWTVTRSCPNLIEHLHAAQADEKNPVDMAKTPHSITHSCDALRYFFRSRPRPAATELDDRTLLQRWKGTSDSGETETYDGYGDVY